MTWTLPPATVALSEDDIVAYLECLRSGWLTMGPRTLEFEKAFSSYTGCSHSFAVSSGDAAMHLALLAVGVKADDEVVISAFTSVDAIGAVLRAKARPVLCDTRADQNPMLDPDAAMRLITTGTKAVVVSHPFGFPAPLSELSAHCREHGVALVEDVTNALGGVAADADRRLGTVGDVGVFSFAANSQLPLGEGGMVVTNDDAVAAQVKLLRSHGMTTVTWDRHRGHATSYDVVAIGFNYRLDEPRSALGTSRLRRIDLDTRTRRALAFRYRELLREAPTISTPWEDEDVSTSSPSGFPIVAKDRFERDRLRLHLTARGIGSSIHRATTQFSFYRALQPGADVPHAEAFGDRHCILPLDGSTTGKEVEAAAAATVELVLQRG